MNVASIVPVDPAALMIKEVVPVNNGTFTHPVGPIGKPPSLAFKFDRIFNSNALVAGSSIRTCVAPAGTLSVLSPDASDRSVTCPTVALPVSVNGPIIFCPVRRPEASPPTVSVPAISAAVYDAGPSA
jgi:hypothetical protein